MKGKAGLEMGLPGLSQGNFDRAPGSSAIPGMPWCNGWALPVFLSPLRVLCLNPGNGNEISLQTI